MLTPLKRASDACTQPMGPRVKVLGLHACPWGRLSSICWDLSLGGPYPGVLRASHGYQPRPGFQDPTIPVRPLPTPEKWISSRISRVPPPLQACHFSTCNTSQIHSVLCPCCPFCPAGHACRPPPIPRAEATTVFLKQRSSPINSLLRASVSQPSLQDLRPHLSPHHCRSPVLQFTPCHALSRYLRSSARSPVTRSLVTWLTPHPQASPQTPSPTRSLP